MIRCRQARDAGSPQITNKNCRLKFSVLQDFGVTALAVLLCHAEISSSVIGTGRSQSCKTIPAKALLCMYSTRD